jgi:hypothetical protein
MLHYANITLAGIAERIRVMKLLANQGLERFPRERPRTISQPTWSARI